MNSPKISDVTKALKKAGFVKVDADAVIFGNVQDCAKYYYKYRGGLHINGANVSFCINSEADARILGAYATGAIDATGAASEVSTDWPHLFFPRLFGYLSGQISEIEIIAEICA